MDTLKTAINAKRAIKPNSVRSYLIIIQKIHDAVFSDTELTNFDFLKETEKVMTVIENLAVTTQKNYISAVIVSLTDLEIFPDELVFYREQYELLKDKVLEELSHNIKTRKQNENWASLRELRAIMNNFKKILTTSGAFKRLDALNELETEMLQKWLVANLYLNNSNPPVRLDYAMMEIVNEKDYDDEERTKNYLIVKSRGEKYYVFNDFKTSKTFKQQIIPIGKQLNAVINIWIKYIVKNKLPPYLILTKSREPMSANYLSKFIPHIFKETGKNITLNSLRHIFISEKNPVKNIKKRETLAGKMLHSTATSNQYSKLL